MNDGFVRCMKRLSIAYLLESTCLCGGVKVVFRQAQALSTRGHHAAVISNDPYPDWLDGHVHFVRNDPFDRSLGAQFDVLVATTPRLVLQHFTPRISHRLFHLVQGYEMHLPECAHLREQIRRAYELPIVKITVSDQITRSLRASFPQGRFQTVGQGIEKHIFWPHPDALERLATLEELRVFLGGPLTLAVKQIGLGLRAFRYARQRDPRLRLVRITQLDTRSDEEQVLGAIDHYYVHVSPQEVGEILRSGPGVLLMPSGPAEGFGLPVLEAMACMVPCVLTNIPSFVSFAHPADYALFVENGNEVGMGEALLRLMADKAERIRLARRGKLVADSFSYEQVAEKLERLWFNEIG